MSKQLPRAPQITYLPINHCIYCGNEKDALSDEHIIPFGLNGNFVLPKSSCAECAKITSEFERKVLRGFLDNGRRAMGVSSRHKKHKKPAATPVKFIAGNTRLDGEMPIENGFHTIHLPIFIAPLALGGESKDDRPDSIDVVGFDTLHIGDAIETLKRHNATGVETQTNVDIWPFIRMLSKIAYSYYVAQIGVFPREESPILSIVLNKHNFAKEWVGCLEDHPLTTPGSKAMHLMDITELKGADGAICSVVRIKLLSNAASPTYSVIVRLQN
ncbi:hypothetical protein [Rheinheimera sp.]|uniref:hypothetical protein n=1 Tax=Rheinheimera sp. TaxID=1869214 RepID=UPI002FDCD668